MSAPVIPMHVIFLNSLWVACAFLLFTLSASLLAYKTTSRLAIVSAVSFGYCTLAQLGRFALQFVPDSRTSTLGNALFLFSNVWPAVLLIAAFASVIGVLRLAKGRAP